MGSVYGKNIRVSIFGQSHSTGVGVVIDGLPAGFRPDLGRLAAFMARRAPGGEWASARREADAFEILSGMAEGRLCGAPLAALIRNTDAHSGDYAATRDIPRPGHGDFTARIRFGGFEDRAGGGHLSGRLTAPLCLAGGLVMQMLAEKGVVIGAHVTRIGDIPDARFDPMSPELARVVSAPFPVLNPEAGAAMAARVAEARAAGDSLGGEIECAVVGLPAGVGDPMFSGLENRIAQAAFAIPGVKGIEFGEGFGLCAMRGSEANDPFVPEKGRATPGTNRAGGILGGMSSGMPVIFRLAIKPTPSIAAPQKSVDLKDMTPVQLKVSGRHDPCIAPRAVPCAEAAAALAVYDALLDPPGSL